MQLLQMFHNLFRISRLLRVLFGVRRVFLIGVCFGLFGTLSACSQNTDESRSTRRAIAQSQAIAADFLRTELALSPETASRLNLERYLGPNANSALDNHSQAGFERRRLVRIELLQRLQSRPKLPDEHPLTRDLLVVERALIDLISLEQLGYGRFDYFDYRPYAIDPFSGIWIEGPALLAYRQSITNADQATAYLARLRALSASVEDTKRRLIADQASGVLLPRALAEETRARLSRLLADEVNGLGRLTETYNALTASVTDLDEAQRERLENLVRLEVDERLRLTYSDLLATLDAGMEETADQAGVWAQPRGQDLYAGILRMSLGEALNTDRLHDSQIDAVTRQFERVSAMIILPIDSETSDNAPPADLSSRLQQLEVTESQDLLAAASLELTPDRADTLLELAPKSEWQIVVEAPSFAAQVDAITQFQSNFDVAPYSTWRTEGAAGQAPYRALTEYPAIESAWKNYVWQRSVDASEASDTVLPVIAGQSISLIQSAFAATDTGIHLNRWSIAEATDFIALNTGLNEGTARQLALSIAARPGYHASVSVAWQRFESLSERAKAVLGERYSEIEFQRTLIEPGPRPLSLIEKDVEAWYGSRLASNTAN